MDLKDAIVELERDFEVNRLVLELRVLGMGPSEISRELSNGKPVWMRRTTRQVRWILRPSHWVNDRQGELT